MEIYYLSQYSNKNLKVVINSTITITTIIIIIILKSFSSSRYSLMKKKNKRNSQGIFFPLTTHLSSHQILMLILGNEPLKIMLCGLGN